MDQKSHSCLGAALAIAIAISPLTLFKTGYCAELRAGDARLDFVEQQIDKVDKLALGDPTAGPVLEAGWRALQQIRRPERPDLPRDHLRLFVRILESIERKMDPAFNPEEPLLMRPPPPKEEGFFRYPSGIDPIAIKDPEVRARYQEAIRLNSEKNIRHGTQVELRQMRDDVIFDLNQLAKDVFGPMGALREYQDGIDKSRLGRDTKALLVRPSATR